MSYIRLELISPEKLENSKKRALFDHHFLVPAV
jgi:hypothetical protein